MMTSCSDVMTSWLGVMTSCLDVVTSRVTPPRRRDVSTNKYEEDAAKNLESCGDNTSLKSMEPLLFPDEDMDEGQFFGEVLSAIQRWFCCNGWPNSFNIITVPDSLRRYDPR